MNVSNQNQETDSFRITQNADGSYTAEWDKEDPNWKWLNGLTSKELQVIIEQAVKEHKNDQF
jgi:hypothetical protein